MVGLHISDEHVVWEDIHEQRALNVFLAVGDCVLVGFHSVHQMNKYLSHAYILKNTLKASKSYIQERKRNKRKPTKEEVMILHEIRRPNSLKTVPSGVANYRNLPFGGRATRGSPVHLPREENARSRHQRVFEENVGKTKCVVYEL